MTMALTGILLRIVASATKKRDGYLVGVRDFDQLRSCIAEASENGSPMSWRCFYCNDVFTREQDAREHFGDIQGTYAGCQIKGHENNLLRVIREQEVELSRHRAEDTELIRAIEALRSEHAVELRQAEELGYSRGLHADRG